MPISRFTNFTFAYLTNSIKLKNYLQWMPTLFLNLLARVIYQKKALILADTKNLGQLMARKKCGYQSLLPQENGNQPVKSWFYREKNGTIGSGALLNP